ncbi:MAG: VPLPA-CTERM sorting domain-containing protein [Sneathiella sp.]|nr:VPLPA-CTERM sorting domain-containing protein [Sneathiella sp.]
MKIQIKESGRVIAGIAIAASTAFASIGISSVQAATYLPDYLVIATGQSNSDKNNVGNPLHLSDSELGAIGANGAVSPPGSVPNVPGIHGSARASSGITYDGDVAITETNGVITSSKSHIYSQNTGAGNQGTQGIECAGLYSTCTDSGKELDADSKHGTPGPNLTNLGENKGVQGGFSTLMTDLKNEAQTLTTNYWNLAETPAYDGMFEFDVINSDTKSTFGSGLNVVDLGDGDSKFLLQNSTWTISGVADTFVIFRLQENAYLDITQANLLVDQTNGMGLNNVLFLVDADSGVNSFNFNNVFFNGISFWDYGRHGEKNVAGWNNVQGCGQVMTDSINFNNVSMTGCSFEVSVVPLPAAFPLFGAALAVFGFAGWRKRCNA